MLASTKRASTSISSAWALPAEAARAVAPSSSIVPPSEAFSFFGSMVSRVLGGNENTSNAGDRLRRPAPRQRCGKKSGDSMTPPCGTDARCGATSSAGDPGPGRYRWVSSLTLEGSRSVAEQPAVRHQGRDHVRGVRDEERLVDRRALVELDDSRSQVERLAIRPVHGLVELDGVPEGGPDATGHHDHGLLDGVVVGLADRQSLVAAVDGWAFDLEVLNAHRGKFRELPVDRRG